MYAAMMIGYRQELVSRLTVARVDKHCGANTYHASSESAVGRLHDWEINGVNAPLTSSPAADSAYTVPSAPTATSRAASPGTNAIDICQLKPMGANSTASQEPRCPAMLYWIAGPVAPGGGAGNELNAQRITISERMIVPTRLMNISTRCQRPMPRLRKFGQ